MDLGYKKRYIEIYIFQMFKKFNSSYIHKYNPLTYKHLCITQKSYIYKY